MRVCEVASSLHVSLEVEVRFWICLNLVLELLCKRSMLVTRVVFCSVDGPEVG